MILRLRIFKYMIGKEMSPSFSGKLGTHMKREALWKDVRAVGRVGI